MIDELYGPTDTAEDVARKATAHETARCASHVAYRMARFKHDLGCTKEQEQEFRDLIHDIITGVEI